MDPDVTITLVESSHSNNHVEIPAAHDIQIIQPLSLEPLIHDHTYSQKVC